MKGRDRREKASDLFKKGTSLFGRKVTFEEEFPDIENLTVEVEESGYGAGGWGGSKKSTYEKDSYPGEFIDCNNPLCHGGGFSISKILWSMYKERQSELDTSELCRGKEGSPKGRRTYRKCMNAFGIKVSVKYRPTQ